MRPKVSVILPSLNVKGYIRECLESVLSQTMEEIEIICVDAGSDDGTFEIIKEYACRDSRIAVLQSSEKSYGRQTNMGIGVARGEYIAIVETDDFVAKDMYECLYGLAKKNDADYVKADYDFYVTLRNGNRLYKTIKLFPAKDLYGAVVTPEEHLELFTNDSAIWKGIYSKDFLQRNLILFHESKGASFQDIGFKLQVLCHAKRAVYIDRSFYRYCLDRESSSSNCMNCLRYVYQEFRWLLDEQVLGDDVSGNCWNGIYRRMANSFLGEADKFVKHGGLQSRGKIEKAHYIWLKNRIDAAIEAGILKEYNFSRQNWFELNLLTHSFEGYFDYSYVKNKMAASKERKLLDCIAGRRVVIFGYGTYGFILYQLLDKNEVDVLAVCDNNKVMWGVRVGGVLLEPPHKCMEQYKEDVFVIANKYYADDIYNQLLRGGIKSENIIRMNL